MVCPVLAEARGLPLAAYIWLLLSVSRLKIGSARLELELFHASLPLTASIFSAERLVFTPAARSR